MKLSNGVKTFFFIQIIFVIWLASEAFSSPIPLPVGVLETEEQIHNRVNEQYWNATNACWDTCTVKKIEFDQAGHTGYYRYIVRTRVNATHCLLCKPGGNCYDDLQGVTLGVNPTNDVLMAYPLVRVIK